MKNTNTGGPAFPTKNYKAVVPVATGYAEGMTLRDYFAAKVLPSLYLDYVNEQRMEGERIKIGSPHDPGVSAECLALECYAIADAMLAARNYKDD
jgi:hypothetical protein